MSVPIIISGSLAIDSIMDFSGLFADYLLEDSLHKLSVSFSVDNLKKTYGGAAGNIAYGAKLFGKDPVIVSALGNDAAMYVDYLDGMGISTEHIVRDADLATAAAHIITDSNDSQITAFYEGPLARAGALPSHEKAIAMISPTTKAVMMRHMAEASAKGYFSVFDPGQQVTSFNSEELRLLVSQASAIIVNDYEMEILEKSSGMSHDELVAAVDFIVITLGVDGVEIFQKGNDTVTIPAIVGVSVVDPTGAGDAFRAGFFSGYADGRSLGQCARMGCVAASYAIGVNGTQSYTFSLQDLEVKYAEHYHESLTLS